MTNVFFQCSGNASYQTRLIGVIILIQTMSIVQSQAGNMMNRDELSALPYIKRFNYFRLPLRQVLSEISYGLGGWGGGGKERF